MTLTVLTGGVRCGKSAAASAAAAATGAPVVFVATAEPGDDDMAVRIERHRADRPDQWTTVEAPRNLAAAVDSAGLDATVVIDCLGLWVTNRMLDDPPATAVELIREAEALALRLAARPGRTLVVTNEVGSGVVPATPLGRDFRDLLGLVNQAMVRVADAAYLVVAGRLLALADPAAGSCGQRRPE